MRSTEHKMVLGQEALTEARTACTAAAGFLDPASQQANVVGMGVGVKWTGGEPTGEPALLVLVTHKLDRDQLRAPDLVPAQIAGMQTDVLAVGYPFADSDAPPDPSAASLAQRTRPARGGYSVGHHRISAGTIATSVYDILPGGSVSPPSMGIGIPPRYYLLSNNHVIANSNDASPGDAVLQPGPHDGGSDPRDRIARLNRFIPIAFDPPTPRDRHDNLVDAAIAEGEFVDLNREVYWTGPVRAWRRRDDVQVGTVVQKTGRTTHYTVGRITATDATIDVGFGGGRVARFRDQIVTTAISAGGDSGSLVTTLDGVAVGLLFAGSTSATIANQIEHVRSLLRVEVAERMG